MDEKKDAPVKESLENIGCDLARDLYDNIGKRKLWLSIIMSVLRAAGRKADAVHQKRVAEIKAKCADHTRTHNALRELCRQRGTSLEEQSRCGEDIVLWADAVMRELDADLDQAIAWVRGREDEWDAEKDARLIEIIHRRLRYQTLKGIAPIPSTADRILAFLDAIETTEIVTADGGDRDVDPHGYGFSDEMLKLIEAIAEDENDVWNTAARIALAGPTSRNLQAIHWREAFDMAIGCIEFAATNKNDGPEFLNALRKYADLMIQELEPNSAPAEDLEGEKDQ